MKNLTTKLTAILIALLIAAVLPLTALAAANDSDFTATAAETRNGVVRVITIYECKLYNAWTNSNGAVSHSDSVSKTESVYTTGTAFGVGTAGEETDIFVTNRHVVTMANGAVKMNSRLYWAEYTPVGYYILLDNYAFNPASFTTLDTSRTVPFTVIYTGEDDAANTRDVAILRAANPVPNRIALALQDSEDALEVGDSITALGYPGTSDSATSDGYLLASVDDVTLSSGIVSRFYESASVTTDSDSLLKGRMIQHDAAINGGNSGGPLIDKNGTVVGINTYTVYSSNNSVSNTYYALRIRYAKDALDSLGIDYDVYTGKASTSAGADSVEETVSAAEAAPVEETVAAAETDPVKETVSTVETNPAKETVSAAGSSFAIIVAVLVLVAVVVIAVVVFGKRRNTRKNDPSAAHDSPVEHTAPLDSGFRLQATSGTFAGQRFPINNQVRIGRDPAKNDLIYPANTQGISGVHCVVFVSNGQVYLKDLGSKYGTFINGSQQLAGNQTVLLHKGDSFYLASSKECFMITGKGGVVG